MPIDATRVALAVSQGLSVVCATCEKYHRAQDLGVADSKCLAQDGCGSPIAGDVFHEYQGPMVRFDQFCFVCGNQATHAVRVDSSVRVIGICTPHVDFVKRLKPANKRAARIVLISKDGDQVLDEDTPPEPIIMKFKG